jgi:outer membrane immunogenic protein
MRKLLLASGSAVALLGASAGAADLRPVAGPAPVYVPPSAVAVFTWAGCYAGGNVGGIRANSNWGDTALGDLGSTTASGALGGAQAGCNYQVGAWVFGIQGDYDWTNVSSNVANGIPATLAFGLTNHTQYKSLSSVTGRVGLAWDRLLAYAKGGGAWVQADVGFQAAALPLTSSATLSQSGWTVGVGGEYAFLNWLTGFVEYDFYRFNNNSPATLTCAAAACGIATTGVAVTTNVNVVKAGLNFKFNPF